MSYTPKEGSVPARAIAHLAQMADVEISSADLADAIDAPRNGFQAGMEAAIKHGAVHYRVVGRTGYYSLAEPDEDPPRRSVVSAAGKGAPETTAAPSVFALGAQVNPQVTSGFKGWPPRSDAKPKPKAPARTGKLTKAAVALIPAPVTAPPPSNSPSRRPCAAPSSTPASCCSKHPASRRCASTARRPPTFCAGCSAFNRP